MNNVHFPVLYKEVLDALEIKKDGIYLDATLGTGGHSELILKQLGVKGKLIGIDKDIKAIEISVQKLSDERAILRRGNFKDMGNILLEEGISEVDGILFDLGISMVQMKDFQRGFSFLSDERLDMRIDTSQKLSAWEVVNNYSEKDLSRILWEYGEEKYSRKIAYLITKNRQKRTIDTCAELAEIVKSVYRKRGRIHPATKTFQALRIEVNKELEHLNAGLCAAERLLKKSGRLCVISYHSLEDRLVKQFITEKVKEGFLKKITKKPITASSEEIKKNPASRSAKLRVAEKL